jgi:hypothetical protein
MLFLLPACALAALPAFPSNWAVHEDQLAKVAGSVFKWHGHVYNDQTNTTFAGCKTSIHSHTGNCTATAYVDDSGKKSTYHFYETEEAYRGLTYFVGPVTSCFCDMAAEGQW